MSKYFLWPLYFIPPTADLCMAYRHTFDNASSAPCVLVFSRLQYWKHCEYVDLCFVQGVSVWEWKWTTNRMWHNTFRGKTPYQLCDLSKTVQSRKKKKKKTCVVKISRNIHKKYGRVHVSGLSYWGASSLLYSVCMSCVYV